MSRAFEANGHQHCQVDVVDAYHCRGFVKCPMLNHVQPMLPKASHMHQDSWKCTNQSQSGRKWFGGVPGVLSPAALSAAPATGVVSSVFALGSCNYVLFDSNPGAWQANKSRGARRQSPDCAPFCSAIAFSQWLDPGFRFMNRLEMRFHQSLFFIWSGEGSIEHDLHRRSMWDIWGFLESLGHRRLANACL